MPTPGPAGIAAEDLVAVRVYLTRDHARINHAVRALDMPALQELNASIRMATYGLSLLPDHRGNITFAVRSINGRLARALAEKPAEMTVMFFTGTCFEVLDVRTLGLDDGGQPFPLPQEP